MLVSVPISEKALQMHLPCLDLDFITVEDSHMADTTQGVVTVQSQIIYT